MYNIKKMKLYILLILFLACISCKNKSIKGEINSTKPQRIELLPEPDKIEKEKYLKQLNLNSFLENPIDLQNFKKLKDRNVTTTIANGMNYHFCPNYRDSLFYSYNYPTKRFKNPKEIDEILVFKYGNNKQKYEDLTEILIELNIYNNDPDLGKANLVGLTKKEIESKFGVHHINLENRIVYSHNNKTLIIELEDSKVKSFRYIKLKTEKVDINLIREITNVVQQKL